MIIGMATISSALAAIAFLCVLILRLLRLVEHLQPTPPRPVSPAPPAYSGTRAKADDRPRLWADDVLAEHEQEERHTIGADAYLVDTFAAEEDERLAYRESALRAASEAKRRRPPD